MKKLFILTTIFAAILTACNFGSTADKDGNSKTTLTINNMSSYNLLSVEYDSVDFGDINSGKDNMKEVRPGTRYIFFNLLIKDHQIRCRTAGDPIICDENKNNPFTFNNNTLITTTTGDENSNTLKNTYDALVLESNKPQISVKQGTTAIIHDGEFNFGTIVVNTTKEITFTIENTGGADLVIESVNDNRINLTDNSTGFFNINLQPLSPTVASGKNTTFSIQFNPTTVGNDYVAAVRIKTNSRNNSEYTFRVMGNARNASSEARLNELQFTAGTLDPLFNRDVHSYNLRITAETAPTQISVKPTSMDSNIASIKINGIGQSSGTQSENMALASTTTVTIAVTAENGTTTATYIVNIKIIKTWEKLHGEAGRRYGIYRAVYNGQNGIYAGGFIGNSTAALFNIDTNGNILNRFTYSSFESTDSGTLGPRDMGVTLGDYFSVMEDTNGSGYYITKATSPSVSPSRNWTGLTYNSKEWILAPTGISKSNDGTYYFVAGNSAYYYNASNPQRSAVFINRHFSWNSEWDDGNIITLSATGVKADSYWVNGMAILTNGDVLLYGGAEATSGRTIAYAAAVNVSATNANSWSVRWINTYEITNKITEFCYHFIDSNATNIIIIGYSDDGGYILKFPKSATTAALAKPTGWPKTINAPMGGFYGGLPISDGSGFLFVGNNSGPNGGLDSWIVKTDINVNGKIWEKYCGGAGDEYTETAIEVSDGFIIAGMTQSPSIAGQTKKGTQDMYILKINKDGTMD